MLIKISNNLSKTKQRKEDKQIMIRKNWEVKILKLLKTMN